MVSSEPIERSWVMSCITPERTRGDMGDYVQVIYSYFLQDIVVEEHRSLGGSIISRVDNGAFVGLIY